MQALHGSFDLESFSLSDYGGEIDSEWATTPTATTPLDRPRAYVLLIYA